MLSIEICRFLLDTSLLSGDVFNITLRVKPNVALPTRPKIQVYAVKGDHINSSSIVLRKSFFAFTFLNNLFCIRKRINYFWTCFKTRNTNKLLGIISQRNNLFSGFPGSPSTAMRRWDHAPFFSYQQQKYSVPFYVRDDKSEHNNKTISVSMICIKKSMLTDIKDIFDFISIFYYIMLGIE